MKLTLFIIGLLLIVIIFIIDSTTKVELGYFILASSVIVAASMWKTEEYSDRQLVAMQRVYAALASQPKTMEDLVDKLRDVDDSEFRNFQLSVIGLMLAKQLIVIRDGLVSTRVVATI